MEETAYIKLAKVALFSFEATGKRDDLIQLIADLLEESDKAHGYLDNAADTYDFEFAEKHHGGMGILAYRIHNALKSATLGDEKVSARCKRTHFQACHVCEKLDCGDNTNEELKREAGLV